MNEGEWYTLSLISLKIRNDLFFISGSLGKRPESLRHFERDLELCLRQEGGHGYHGYGINSSQVSKGYSLSKSVLFPLAFWCFWCKQTLGMTQRALMLTQFVECKIGKVMRCQSLSWGRYNVLFESCTEYPSTEEAYDGNPWQVSVVHEFAS